MATNKPDVTYIHLVLRPLIQRKALPLRTLARCPRYSRFSVHFGNVCPDLPVDGSAVDAAKKYRV